MKMNDENQQNIIIYNTADGKASVSLYAKDGNVWMNQNQLAELFDTSVPNISMHISNILNECELQENSVIKDYLTTATDGKQYTVTYCTLDRILGFQYKKNSRINLISQNGTKIISQNNNWSWNCRVAEYQTRFSLTI